MSADQVFIVGVGITPLGKHLDESVKALTSLAVNAALQDAAVDRRVVQAAWFSNTRQGALEGQHGIRGHVALRAAGFESIPIYNTDSACASSSSALMLGFMAIRAGVHDVVLIVGAEKMNYPERRQEMFDAFKGSWDRENGDQQIKAVLAMGDGLEVPADARQPQGERSIFMDLYAAQARFHMKTFGTTQKQIAAVAAKNHDHSQHNEFAQYRFPMTTDEVLADRIVSWPMTRSMCAPMSDGAAAILLCSSSALPRFDAARAVRVRGIGVSSSSPRSPEQYQRHLTSIAAQQCYRMAAIGPEDVSVAEVHDASAIAEIIQSEHLGLCAYGEGARLATEGASRLGGRQPINVSGGLVSKGHPIAATGAIQIHDLVRQLRGEAGDGQVPKARIGLAENGGGFLGVEEAACVVTMLEKPSCFRH